MPIVCKWKKTEDGWKLWKKGKPKICGEGRTYEEAWDSLLEALPANGISVLENAPIEYDKPLPPSAEAEKYMHPELYIIEGGEQFDMSENSSFGIDDSPFFEGRTCPCCDHGVGKRTDVPITISSVLKTDAAYVRIHSVSCRSLYSDDFLTLLTAEEKERLNFRPVEYTERCNKRKCDYYELSANTPIPFIGIKGYDARGLLCRMCGHSRINYNIGKSPLDRYICKSDLPDPLPSCFAVGTLQDPYICLTRERWDQIRGHKFAKGLCSEVLGVLPDELSERKPDQQNFPGKCETCLGWRNPVNEKGQSESFFKFPFNQKCVIDNVEWIKQAEKNDQLDIITENSTITYDDMLALIKSGQKPLRDEYLSFRCKDCRILGNIKISQEKLSLNWWGGEGNLMRSPLCALEQGQKSMPVKLIFYLQSSNLEYLENFQNVLSLIGGASESRCKIWKSISEDSHSKQTQTKEYGIILSFKAVYDPWRIIKTCNNVAEIKKSLAERMQLSPDLLRVDMGYLTPEKLVTISKLEQKHRRSIGKGFYSEDTLSFVDGQWQGNDYTPPIFKMPECFDWLGIMRERLIEQLKYYE